MSRHRSPDDDLVDIPLFEGLSKKQLGFVSRLSTQVELPAGFVLARQGTLGSQFFIVIDGRVEVRQHGVPIALRGPGSCLGEIALLGADRRTATLITRTPLQVRVASRREFYSLLTA